MLRELSEDVRILMKDRLRDLRSIVRQHRHDHLPARPVADAAEVSVADLDALILPGGFGAAKNLCDFADKGGKGTVFPSVAALIKAMHAAKKPIGAICIAPAVLAPTIRSAQCGWPATSGITANAAIARTASTVLIAQPGACGCQWP